MLNVDKITGPEDFRAFAGEVLVLAALVHDNDGGGYAETGGSKKKIEEVCDQFELVLAALCYAFHVDLLRGEALECYDPDLFWTEETAVEFAAGEDDERETLLGRSSVGAGIQDLLDHVFNDWL